MSWCRSIVVLFLSFFFSFSVFAQDIKSEAELKKKAEQLFEEQDYVAAFPHFSQLLSLYPKDPNYNFKFGVCLLFTTEDKEKPLKYLEFASKKPETEKEVFFFLGRAYHLNYRFADAITAYDNFKKNGSPKTVKKYEVEQHINMCRNGSTLLRNIRDLYVLEKKNSRDEDFFRAYNAEGSYGKLIVKPDEFKTSIDKRKKENSIIFLSRKSDELYISSYGSDEKNGKDIFRLVKSASGEWGTPENIGAVINTPFDEDYPFMHPDGKTLYFSSKGHNSMGGYDVFKSTYDPASKTWSKPVNLDFAISTPDDDILYLPDSSNTFAYFASRRNSAAGNLEVFKLRIDKQPTEVALIKGTLASEIGSGSKAAKITVKNAKGEKLGEYTTNEKTGEYLISVPNGGKFTFQVESDVMSARSETVEVPTQYELRALRQTILIKPDKLVINNFFDDILADESSYMAAVNFLKKRATLEVNYNDSKQPEAKTEAVVENNTTVPESTGVANTSNVTKAQTQSANQVKFSNEELVNIAKEDAADSRKEAEELQDKSDNALFAGKTKEEEAQQKLKTAQEVEASLAGITDPVKKEEETYRASVIKKEGELLNKEAEAVKLLAQNLYKESQEKFKEAKQNEQYAKDLETAVQSNSKESILKLTEQRSQLEASAGEEKQNDYGLQQMKEEAETKQEEASKAEKRVNDLQTELSEAEAEQNTIREQANNTKNKKEKQVLIQQADILTADIEEKRKKVSEQKEKAALARSEANSATAQLETFTKVLGGSALAENPTPTTSIENQAVASAEVPAPEKPTDAVDQKFKTELNAKYTMADGSEKQRAIAQVYDTWGAELQAEAEKRKAGLKKISDPKKKSDEADAIAALEAASSEKLALAADARANADVASSETKTQNNTSVTTEQPVTVNTEQPGNKEPEVASAVTVAAEKVKADQQVITTKYESELKTAEAITDEAQKEKAKTEVLDKWVKALEQEASSVRTDISNSTDEAVKTELQNQLKNLETAITEKQSQASLAFAKAERLNKEKAAVTSLNSSGVNAAYSETYKSKLSSADTISNESEKQSAKARLYEEWAAEVNKEKAEKQQLLAGTTDENAKADLTRTIEDLDQFEKQQRGLAEQSRQASTQAQASTPASENKTTASIENKSVTPVEIMQLNDGFEKQLGQVETSADSVKANQEKARINSEWAKQLNLTAEKIRTDAASSNDEDVKKVELLRAEELEVQAKSKQEESTRLLASASQPTATNTIQNNEPAVEVKQTNTIAENVAQNQNTQPTIVEPAPVQTEKYEASISEIDNQADEVTKAEQKTRVFDQWANDIDKQVAYLKEKKATASSEEAVTIDAKISELEKDALDKRTKASLNVAKADRLKKQQAAQLALQNADTTAVVQKQGAPAETTVPKTEPAASSGPSQTVLAKLNESARLKHESDSIRTSLVSISDEQQRAAALSRSGQLEKESYIARVSASESMASETGASYNTNKGKLDQYAASTSRNQADEVTMANMLASESAYYFKEAGNIRAAVQNGEASVPKINALERAEEYEKLAVEKQERAINLYAKVAGPVTTSVQPVITAPLASTNSNEVKEENNPVKAENVNAVSVSKVENTSPDSSGSANKTSEPAVISQEAKTVMGDTAATKKIDQPAFTNSETPSPSPTADTVKTEAPVTAKKYSNASDSIAAGRIITEADRLEKVAAGEQKLEQDLKLKSEREKLVSDSLLAESEKPDNSSTKGTLLTESDQHKALSLLYKQRADSVHSMVVNSTEAAKAKREEASLLALNTVEIKTQPVENPELKKSADPVSGTNIPDPQPKPTPVKTSAELADLEIPSDYLTESNELKREIFRAFAKQPAYSAARPIPLNEKLPNGLVFKVQVGAFRKAISPEVFKGFAPLMGETSETGITRYTAGLFKSFESANQARKEISGMGYKDAFVVAFCNGKRIPNNEAFEMIRTGKSCPVQGEAVAAKISAPSAEVPVENKTNAEVTPVKAEERIVAEMPKVNQQPAINIPVEQVQGLFYTVQVGVFSGKVPASKLNYLQPLFTEPADNGKFRYSVGMYNDLSLAKKARSIVTEYGINDAFVTAYVNGKRISVAEAARIEAEKGKSVFATTGDINKMPEAGYGNEDKQRALTPSENRTTETPVPASENKQTQIAEQPLVNVPVTPAFNRTPVTYIPLSDTGLVFRVQIGAFKDEVPVDIAAKFIKIADKGINHFVSSDSLTIYTVGGSRDYESSVRLKEEVAASAGLSDSFIVAYRRGERIPIEEAMKESNLKY